MEVTLDEYLAKIDRWKQAVSDRMLELSPEERTEQDRAAQAWLEKQLGRRLRVAEVAGSGSSSRAS